MRVTIDQHGERGGKGRDEPPASVSQTLHITPTGHSRRPAIKTRISLFAAHFLSHLLVIALITTVFSVLLFITARRDLEREIGGRLRDIARIVAKNAPYERLSLIRRGDDQSRMILRLREKLEEIREATGVRDIVIFRPDGSVLIALDPNLLIGSHYESAELDVTARRILLRGESYATKSYRTANGTLIMSAFTPVMDPKGAFVALIGVDAGTREIEVLERLRSRLYVVGALGVFLAIGLAYALSQTLSRPIREMADTAARIGLGEYEARVADPVTLELRRLAEAINDMARQVRERDSRLKEMSAGVAHEIRNPLNSIKLLITLLGEEMQDRKEGDHERILTTLHYEIGKLNRFLTEFLTYSRPMTLIRETVSPQALLASAAEMAAGEAAEGRVTLETHVADNLPAIEADRARLEQALLNIVLNAVQASPEGSVVKLSAREGVDRTEVVFVVEDRGPGIAPDVRQRLFEPFVTTKSTGTGLGLANASLIIGAHGGGIAVNDTGNGTRFVVRIPVRGQGTENADG